MVVTSDTHFLFTSDLHSIQTIWTLHRSESRLDFFVLRSCISFCFCPCRFISPLWLSWTHRLRLEFIWPSPETIFYVWFFISTKRFLINPSIIEDWRLVFFSYWKNLWSCITSTAISSMLFFTKKPFNGFSTLNDQFSSLFYGSFFGFVPRTFSRAQFPGTFFPLLCKSDFFIK